MDDHRKFSRVQEKAAVSVRVLTSPEVPDLENKVFPFHSVNISLGGVMLWVDIPVPVGSYIELLIDFDHPSDQFWHKGNVVWVEDDVGTTNWHYIGIKFTMLTNAQFYTWQEEISRLLELRMNNVED